MSEEEWQRLFSNVALENAPLYIDETPALSVYLISVQNAEDW